MARATVKMVKDFFPGVTVQELRDLKAMNDGRDYDEIFEGIGDGTLTY